MPKIKTKEELLAAYKKANKLRREVIANKAGFDSGDDYLAHLLAGISSTKDTKELVIHNVHILDCSGSMNGSKIINAVRGINSEIDDLKGDTETTYLQSFVPFSYGGSSFRLPTAMAQPIGTVSKVTARASGYTALYQALGETLEYLKANKSPNEKTLVKVFTDGGENDSKGKYADSGVLSRLIDSCKELDITVTFVGTKTDVGHVISRLKIDESNTLVHQNTAESVQASFLASTKATRGYIKKAKAGEDTLVGFYKQSGTL